MKIPVHIYVNTSAIVEQWVQGAQVLSMETGVFIQVGTEYNNSRQLIRIYFDLDGHQFESLNDLKRAINNKVFL